MQEVADDSFFEMPGDGCEGAAQVLGNVIHIAITEYMDCYGVLSLQLQRLEVPTEYINFFREMWRAKSWNNNKEHTYKGRIDYA